MVGVPGSSPVAPTPWALRLHRYAVWAVHALRKCVLAASACAAASWSSGALVAPYTSALSGELAVDEFKRLWSLG